AALIELGGRSLKGQIKQADRSGAANLVIFGGERAAYDAAVKNMRTGDQRELEGMTEHDYIESIVKALAQ
ncbi:MAG: hypothetical protein JJE27_03965, partial [Thermoleophilia bacterium]|nr:hypothetical protein [Thermoleophilia bacterium]